MFQFPELWFSTVGRTRHLEKFSPPVYKFTVSLINQSISCKCAFAFAFRLSSPCMHLSMHLSIYTEYKGWIDVHPPAPLQRAKISIFCAGTPKENVHAKKRGVRVIISYIYDSINHPLYVFFLFSRFNFFDCFSKSCYFHCFHGLKRRARKFITSWRFYWFIEIFTSNFSSSVSTANDSHHQFDHFQSPHQLNIQAAILIHCEISTPNRLLSTPLTYQISISQYTPIFRRGNWTFPKHFSEFVPHLRKPLKYPAPSPRETTTRIAALRDFGLNTSRRQESEPPGPDGLRDRKSPISASRSPCPRASDERVQW